MNWQNLIEEILRHGYTIRRIAEEVKTSECTIRYIYKGKTKHPRPPLSQNLLILYYRLEASGSATVKQHENIKPVEEE